MRLPFSLSFAFCVALVGNQATAQEAPPPDGTADAPPELAIPALPEGYVLSVRGASNDRWGPGPGEFRQTEVEEVRPLRQSDPVERVLLELGGGIVGVGAAMALGYAAGLMEGSEELRTAATLVFAYLFVPTYTWLGGSIIGGGAGTWGGAFIGESIGICIGALFAWWSIEERSEEGMWTSLLLVPTLGAIIGLEIQHDLRVSQRARDEAERANEDLVVSMSVAPVQGGGIAVLSGHF